MTEVNSYSAVSRVRLTAAEATALDCLGLAFEAMSQRTGSDAHVACSKQQWQEEYNADDDKLPADYPCNLTVGCLDRIAEFVCRASCPNPAAREAAAEQLADRVHAAAEQVRRASPVLPTPIARCYRTPILRDDDDVAVWGAAESNLSETDPDETFRL